MVLFVFFARNGRTRFNTTKSKWLLQWKLQFHNPINSKFNFFTRPKVMVQCHRQ